MSSMNKQSTQQQWKSRAFMTLIVTLFFYVDFCEWTSRSYKIIYPGCFNHLLEHYYEGNSAICVKKICWLSNRLIQRYHRWSGILSCFVFFCLVHKLLVSVQALCCQIRILGQERECCRLIHTRGLFLARHPRQSVIWVQESDMWEDFS